MTSDEKRHQARRAEMGRRRQAGCVCVTGPALEAQIHAWAQEQWPGATFLTRLVWNRKHGGDHIRCEWFTETPEQAFYLKLRWA